ncbi:DUF4249 domain-containing protein [Flavivirga eckloniae]|uniref:DUF4249 domain-containing protein n=1 Tax=Flavivirga eckloniae TaxID=1803846 RepID=A0A2K9PTQ7_9FLAO|nr:DUF4249 domain-containing protein [Flavivirga eckloniae]AUP80442.1 hypothetical protein C1H87_17675 [Flavivirga eckloniae]
MKKTYYYFLFVFLVCCVEPESPKFKFEEGMIYIDAYASTAQGESFVIISESGYKFNKFLNEFLPGANVRFRNTETNTTVQLFEQNEIYLPPDNFNAAVGDSWELLITLADGRHYQSLPENIIQPVNFTDIKANYDPELLFRESANDFVPGHFISVDVHDPADEKNFYHWRYRTFEKLADCEKCENSIFRNGICDHTIGKAQGLIVHYRCETDCWKIRFNENIKIFSDEFTNGEVINALEVADIPYYKKGNILVEIQQYSLSEAAYKYFKVLKDILDNSSGINAPPPAALIGNVFNPDDKNEIVLGRFTAASTTTKRLFIDRSNITESQIEPLPREVFRETCLISTCTPQECEDMTCEPVKSAPCTENRFRTAFMPEGWQE